MPIRTVSPTRICGHLPPFQYGLSCGTHVFRGHITEMAKVRAASWEAFAAIRQTARDDAYFAGCEARQDACVDLS